MRREHCHGLAAAFLMFAAFCPLVHAQSSSKDTVAVLSSALAGELYAHQAYTAFAKKAVEEKYQRIGELFTALATSEGVHARNFAEELRKLGAGVSTAVPEIVVDDTKTNLAKAADAELHEIDIKYPAFLKRVQAERQEGAARFITWAWQAEKQHRDLALQLLNGSNSMFGLVARSIEGNKVSYFICQNCGSTLVELPRDKCPNCGYPVSEYIKVGASVD